MIKNCPSRSCLAALFCFFLSAAPCLAQSSITIVAEVNGDVITSHQLDSALEPEIRARGINRNNASAVQNLRAEVLEELIDEILIRQQLASEGFEVTDDLVQRELAGLAAQNNLDVEGFKAEMAKQGIAGEALLARMRNNIYVQYIIGMYYIDQIEVPRDDVLAYYREAMRIAPMVRARISMIVYPANVNANDWARRIERGQISFADAAREVSVGPNADRGGDMGMMSVGDLAEGLRQMVMSMQRGQVSPVVSSATNALQVRLDDAVWGAKPPADPNLFPDDETYKLIENMLLQEKIEGLMKDYAAKLRQDALVRVR